MEPSRTIVRLAVAGLAGSALITTAACGDDDGAANTSLAEPTTTAGQEPATTPGPTTTEPATTAGPTSTAGPTTTPGTAVIDPGDGGDYRPAITAADFVERIDNPYLPFLPGSRWVYEGESDGESERVEVAVLRRRRQVMGVDATVVRDLVFAEGELAEATFDWYAQDVEGNVWYLGEDTREYEDGEVVSTEGAWEAGVDGALPGIVMPARPEVGLAYRQEYYAGEAEDMGEVIEVGGSETVTAGRFDDIIVTRDWTPLEPDVIEEKSYAPGVGQVSETQVTGGEGRLELVEHSS